MTFRPAGEARLDLYTDAMLLDIGRVMSLHKEQMCGVPEVPK